MKNIFTFLTLLLFIPVLDAQEISKFIATKRVQYLFEDPALGIDAMNAKFKTIENLKWQHQLDAGQIQNLNEGVTFWKAKCLEAEKAKFKMAQKILNLEAERAKNSKGIADLDRKIAYQKIQFEASVKELETLNTKYEQLAQDFVNIKLDTTILRAALRTCAKKSFEDNLIIFVENQKKHNPNEYLDLGLNQSILFKDVDKIGIKIDFSIAKSVAAIGQKPLDFSIEIDGEGTKWDKKHTITIAPREENGFLRYSKDNFRAAIEDVFDGKGTYKVTVRCEEYHFTYSKKVRLE